MIGNLAQNWPVYLLGGAFIIFVGVAINNSRQVEKEKKEAKAKEEKKFSSSNKDNK